MTKTTKTMTTKQPETKSGIDAIMTKWENVYSASVIDHADNETELYNAGQALAMACVYSVLKKLLNVSPDRRNIAAMRVDVAKHSRIDAAMDVLNDNITIEYDKNGDYTSKTIDGETDKAIIKFLHQCDGDGVDLIGDAWIAILEESNKEDYFSSGWMTRPYKTRKLKYKVYTKSGNKTAEWQTEETTHIQQIFKAIRRSIEAQRAIKSASEKYIYLDRIETDAETETEVKVYDRYNALDIGSETCDCAAVYTADAETVYSIDNAIGKMNLTKRQAEVLALALKGKGDTEIADLLHVKKQTIRDIKNAIATKAIAAGIAAADLAMAKSAAAKDAAVIGMYAADNPDVLITKFDSIGKASKITGIDKGNISRVLNGKKQTAGGYIFKRIK